MYDKLSLDESTISSTAKEIAVCWLPYFNIKRQTNNPHPKTLLQETLFQNSWSRLCRVVKKCIPVIGVRFPLQKASSQYKYWIQVKQIHELESLEQTKVGLYSSAFQNGVLEGRKS